MLLIHWIYWCGVWFYSIPFPEESTIFRIFKIFLNIKTHLEHVTTCNIYINIHICNTYVPNQITLTVIFENVFYSVKSELAVIRKRDSREQNGVDV